MIITLTGPSLTGKSTLAKNLESLNCEELVSFTTRPMRAGEVEGKSYWFITPEQITTYQKNNELLELIQLGKNQYGLSKEELIRVMEKGKIGVLVVAPEGLSQVREYCDKNNISIFSAFINNDKEVLVKRFLERFRNDTLADIDNYAKRLIQFDEEYREWTKPAIDGTMYYDSVFAHYDTDSAAEVMQNIYQQAMDKFNPAKKMKFK